jgi:hypothetical protein
MEYGTTSENIDLIIEKSKNKKDGVYTLRGVTYRVVKGNPVIMASYGEIYQFFYGFLVLIGSYDYSSTCPSKLKSILKGIEV